MAYSAKNLSEALGKEMAQGYRARKIAKLAGKIHHNHRSELSRYLDCKLMQLTAMEEGPEFEFSEGEMQHLISELRSH
ncbi:hypothetical protein [Kiloniella majae]|uniref:hypothetical protein n=1 Tax=Kiloniella majae TaxID=1938558 RepID=UPI000A277EF1|nr:hypothetical protein [Kiloniella majae]